MPITIHISYFASLREKRGVNQETITTSLDSAADVYSRLQKVYAFSIHRENLKVSINDEIKPWNTKIKDNDHIVFIPPVSGG